MLGLNLTFDLSMRFQQTLTTRLYSKMETQETGNWMESGSTKFNKLNCKWKLKWKLEWKLKWKLKEKGPPFGKKKIHVTFFKVN